jgi:hypothetical protein
LIVFVLQWWVYPIIAVCVFTSMIGSYQFEHWRESRRESKGRYPCLAHVISRYEWGTEIYCGMLDGHTGPCGGLGLEACALRVTQGTETTPPQVEYVARVFSDDGESHDDC